MHCGRKHLGCGQMLLRGELEAHFKECEYRDKLCIFCLELLPAAQIEVSQSITLWGVCRFLGCSPSFFRLSETDWCITHLLAPSPFLTTFDDELSDAASVYSTVITRTRFNFVYFVLLAESTKFSSMQKPYMYTRIQVNLTPPSLYENL